MTRKYAVAFFGVVVGLLGAIASRQWPRHAGIYQMTFYSALVLGLLLIGLWQDRRRPRYWEGLAVVLLLHGVTLLLARQMFPFSSVLAIIPLAFSEAVVLFVLMLKLLRIG